MRFDNGTEEKVVVVEHDKMGNIIAMDAYTGKEIWWKTMGKPYHVDTIPLSNGSGVVWTYGIDTYHAVDNNTIYVTTKARGLDFFANQTSGYKLPIAHTIELGYRNGTVDAIDLRTGVIRWEQHSHHQAGANPQITTNTVRSGTILALDKATGQKLWEFNLGAAIGIGGPSIGNKMVFIPTEKVQGLKGAGGSIVAFGLPSSNDNHK